MRAKSVLLLMVALGCGLVASIGITQVMANRNAAVPANEGDTKQIFVAMTDIATGDRINAEMLKLEEWPKDKVPEGALSDPEQVEGRRPKTKLWQGEVILENKLLTDGMLPGAAEEIPLGYRVVSVTVNEESGISDLIRPGDRVDVLLFTRECPGTFCETSVRTIFQDIKVFAVNDVFNLEETEGKTSIKARTVSLLVTPQQIEKFTLASELGEIRLTLRSHEDKDRVELAGATPRALDDTEASDRDAEELEQNRPEASGPDGMDDFLAMLESQKSQATALPVETPAPPDSWTVQVIRGGEVEDVVMELAHKTSTGNAPGGKSSGFSFWRMIAPGRSRSPVAAPAASPKETGPQIGQPKPEPEPEDDDAQEEEPPPDDG